MTLPLTHSERVRITEARLYHRPRDRLGWPLRRSEARIATMTPRKLTAARKKLGLTPTEMARAMGVPYDTYKDWQSGRRSMSALAVRCVELLLIHPATARKLSD